MDLLSAAKSYGKSATGTIEKARIVIYDKRGKVKKPEMKDAASKKGSGLFGSMSEMKSLSKMRSKMGMDITPGGGISSFDTDSIGGNILPDKNKIALRDFTVQFNPSTLSFTGNSGDHISIMNIASGKDNAADKVRNNLVSALYMSVQLIFDSVTPADAFSGDRDTLSPVNAAKNIYSLVSGGKNDVQNRVEGFIGALNNSCTRTLDFNWGNLKYHGHLSRVDANYTMFAPDGRPIRATVDLRMICDDVSTASDNASVDTNYWDNRYEETFLNDSDIPGASMLKGHGSAAKKVGSIFNL